MAGRSREAALKRIREKARREKQEAKRERRNARADKTTTHEVNEDALMEEFARLSADYEANRLTEVQYLDARHRIFVALGVEPDES